MTHCKTCGGAIEWGFDEESKKWVPLEPTSTHADLDRTHVDANGELRADHRTRHNGATVTVTRLRQPVPAGMADGNEEAIVASARRRRRARRSDG